MSNTIKAILTDIEGTTTALSFVTENLFPYAQKHLADYVFDHETEIADLLNDVRTEERNAELTLEEVLEVLQRYIDEDQKVTALKEIQGMIWEAGYKSGEIIGHLYEDAYHGLQRWKEQGHQLFIYSSGSVMAQKLLFGHTEFGDLNHLFSGYYDTTIGHKKQEESYTAIAHDMTIDPENILFLSDNTDEIAAADKAGMQVIILDREKALFENGDYRVVNNFDDILPETVRA